MSWSPAQYSLFESERNRPIFDLLHRLPNPDASLALDIGCGPGNSTELLQRHLSQAEVVGIDSSPDMIEAARQRMPRHQFEVADISNWDDSREFDVIFSNAVLQWVPDHQTLLPKLLGKLRPGGTLAVQIPDNLDEPVHRAMREVAAHGDWASKLIGAAERMANRHPAKWYSRELKDAGVQVDVWRTTYFHQLSGVEALVDWFKSTGLRPFLQPLDPPEQEQFLERYREALTVACPPMADGTVLLPFPRLFFTATRGS